MPEENKINETLIAQPIVDPTTFDKIFGLETEEDRNQFVKGCVIGAAAGLAALGLIKLLKG